jgi:hypothetical protein
MEGVRPLLDLIAERGYAVGRLRGVFHLLIGRRIAKAGDTVVSVGLTWRQLASELKASKFDKHLVTELGADPDTLSPRDRERMWYSAIGLAKVNSLEAHQQAEQLVALLRPHGYVIGGSPIETPSSPPPPPPVEVPKKKPRNRS